MNSHIISGRASHSPTDLWRESQCYSFQIFTFSSRLMPTKNKIQIILMVYCYLQLTPFSRLLPSSPSTMGKILTEWDNNNYLPKLIVL